MEIRNVERRFGSKEVIKGFNLVISAGERVALRGPNGSGKTTLLRCIAGTLTPQVGDISVCGHKAGTLQACAQVGTSLSQERSFYFRLTGRANLLLFSRMRNETKRQAEENVRVLEEELELGEILRLRVDRCSTGMVQQLSIARALLGRPKLLLLDEPSRSLDQGALQRLWAAVERRQGLAALVATHRLADVEHCQREIVLGN